MKFRYFEKDGAIARMQDGFAAPNEILTDDGWEKYAGDGLAFLHFGTEISASEVGESVAEAAE